MRRAFKITILLVVFCATLAFSADRASVPPRKEYAQAAAALEQMIERELRDKQLPAMSIALVDDNEIVWAQGFGYADPERKVPATASTVYRIGSVSKLFTDIGVMQMAEQGKLDIDAPISNYLPDFKPANQFPKPITLRQLMAHRSGLLREPVAGHYFDDAEPTIAATVRSLNDRPLIYEPETRVKYSNAGITVVGYTLESLNRQPFAAHMKQALLAPMGMNSSAFELSPEIKNNLAKAYIWTYRGGVFPAPTFEPGIVPAGSMYSTVLDLGRFAGVLMSEGRAANGQVLKPETLKRMYEPQFAQREPRNFGIGFMLGDLDGHKVVGHGGAVYGFATEFEVLPADKLGAVAITTMDSANGVTTHIVQTALRMMLAVKAGKTLSQIPVTEPVPADLSSKLAGRYGEGESAVDLFEQNGNLYLRRLRGGSQLRLRKLAGALVTDDRLSYGTRIEPTDDAIRIGNEVLKRVPAAKPTAVPQEWEGLIGEYGWDYNILNIEARDGQLVSLIEWYEYEPLEQISKDVFRYPQRGLYDNETITFTRDASGRATQVEVGSVVFKRRKTEEVQWHP
ncbi:MAG TPA: serine hydrolase domain-containing protein [Terriglobales bacterium]|nr:serine hydrolase domain-containing protein [Terriglobales bacterium]